MILFYNLSNPNHNFGNLNPTFPNPKHNFAEIPISPELETQFRKSFATRNTPLAPILTTRKTTSQPETEFRKPFATRRERK